MNKLKMIVMVLLPLFLTISCSEDAPIETTGGITVVVTEAGSNEAVFGAIVTLAGISQSHSTGTDGKVEITDLEEKTYIVKVKKDGYQADSKQVTIQAGKSQALSFSLKKQVPKLKVTPTEIIFTQEDTEKIIAIANENDAAKLTWSMSGIPNWLSVSKQSGTVESAPQNITVKIDRSKLNDGENKAILIVKATNGEGSAEITVKATKKVGQLTADPTTLNFGSAEKSKSITLKNATQVGTISYKLLKKPNWIKSISNKEGTLTKAEKKTLVITVDREGREPATYEGTIQFSSNKNTVSIDVYMTVIAPSAPEVSMPIANDITYNSAKIQAEITSIGSDNVTSYGFDWSKNSNIDYNPSASEGIRYKNNSGDYKGTIDLGGTNKPKKFSHIIRNLSPNTVYYIRAYAVNKVGQVHSSIIQIKTLLAPSLPIVTNIGVENVEATTATFSANLENTGNVEVTEYGFCYSINNSTPTLSDSKIVLGATSSPVAFTFTKEVTDLQEATTYYLRAFATNSEGTSYSNSVVNFTTKTAPPVVINGLLAYYTFDQENANDYLGNNDGILQGSGNNPTFTNNTPNNKGKAVNFTKEKFYLISQCPDKTTESVTYATWVKMSETIPLGYGNSTIYATASYSKYNTVEYRRLSILDNNVYWAGTGSSYFDLDISGILIDSKWHHIVITTTNSADYKLYIDGKLYKENNSTKVTVKNVKNALIGYNFKGFIDNLRIYNRAITQEEVKKIYNAKQ